MLQCSIINRFCYNVRWCSVQDVGCRILFVGFGLEVMVEDYKSHAACNT